MSSETKVSDFNNDLERHSLAWWIVKNISGVTLIIGMLLAARFSWPPLFRLPVTLSQGLIIVGALTSLYHYFLLKRGGDDIQQPKALVCRGGLYAQVRHPMYLGDWVMFGGFFLMAPQWFSLLVLLLAYVSIIKQARIEDDFMALRFQDDFAAWSRTSQLLIPKLL